jgi:hypothetical protein
MILGYTLSGNSSNEGTFFDGSEPPGVLCPNCGTCLNYGYSPQKINIDPSQMYDISYTHDLRRLFSRKFVRYCLDELKSEDSFTVIDAGGTELFYLMPSRVLEFDSDRRRTRFEEPCGVCGGFESVVGARPSFLKNSEQLGPGIFRSDLAFSSGKSKFPLFFVGAEWKERLASQKFRGIEFEAIES